MATQTPARKTRASTSGASGPNAKTPLRRGRTRDACDLLDADHKAVRQLFDDYRALTESRGRGVQAKKRALAERICTELTVHTTIEEDILYPAARSVVKDKRLLSEALVEHATAKDLIAQIRAMDEDDALFDAKVRVLGEYVAHHIKEERTELFPKLRESRLNLVAMRDELAQRKQALLDELQEDAPATEAEPA